ncbi:MAG: NAD(P)-dependent oxidoreductase [Candidatus Aegiribacteria sp.]|nr:NAD(P)-dependent oxidoreductase [Candidatus Aegiribacteria sp.]
MDVLVTGATGFMGRHLVRFLTRQSGLELWCISRNGGQVDGIHVDSVDLTSYEEVAQWHRNKPIIDTIFHLAALIPSSSESSESDDMFFNNLLMMKNIISLGVSDKSSIVNISSSSIYSMDNNVPLTEDMLPQPDNLYSLSKYTGELLCDIAHMRYGISAANLRISAPYGPCQKVQTVINVFLRAALESREITVFGSGNRTQDFTYIDDVIQAIWLACRKKASGAYNIASGKAVTMCELAKTVLHVEPQSKSEIVYSGTPDSQETCRGVFSIEKARNVLGYVPQTSLENGLLHCMDAMKNGG